MMTMMTMKMATMKAMMTNEMRETQGEPN